VFSFNVNASEKLKKMPSQKLMPNLASKLISGLMLLAVQGATAQTSNIDPPLVSWKSGQITAKEIEADILRMPPAERVDTLKDPRILLQIIDNLQIYRELAARAKQEKQVTPDIELAASIAAERHIGLLYLSSTLQKYRENLGDLTPAAREQYELNKSKYDKPERMNAAHILISTKNRTEGQAKSLATSIHEQLTKGADFAALARTHSDDTATKDAGGVLGTFPRGAMVKPFEEAAFKLQKKGEISPPTLSQFGYHSILLNTKDNAGLSSFDDVKDEIIEDLTNKAVGRHRDALIATIRNDSTLKINEKRFEEYTGAKPTRKVAK
jgi:peptidyl-prolyl cis-trans isomerase C